MTPTQISAPPVKSMSLVDCVILFSSPELILLYDTTYWLTIKSFEMSDCA